MITIVFIFVVAVDVAAAAVVVDMFLSWDRNRCTVRWWLLFCCRRRRMRCVYVFFFWNLENIRSSHILLKQKLCFQREWNGNEMRRNESYRNWIEFNSKLWIGRLPPSRAINCVYVHFNPGNGNGCSTHKCELMPIIFIYIFKSFSSDYNLRLWE